MDRQKCYRLTHPLSKISGYATEAGPSSECLSKAQFFPVTGALQKTTDFAVAVGELTVT